MKCPHCGGETEVKDTRANGDGSVRRNRLCKSCKARIRTRETFDEEFFLQSADGMSEKFDPERLMASLMPCLKGVKNPDRRARQLVEAVRKEMLRSKGQVARKQLVQMVAKKLRRIHPQLAERYLVLRPMDRVEIEEDGPLQLSIFAGKDDAR